MKKLLFLGLFAFAAVTTISVSASNQEPAPCPAEQTCCPGGENVPCDTVPCTPAPDCAPEGC